MDDNMLGNTVNRVKGGGGRGTGVGRPSTEGLVKPEPPKAAPARQPQKDEPKVIIVTPDEQPEADDGAEVASVKLVNTLTNPTDKQLPTITNLTRMMSFWTAMQHTLTAENVLSESPIMVHCPHCHEQFGVSKGYVDLPAEWERNYFMRQLSVNSDHAVRLTGLAEMQITGTPDDEAAMGMGQ